MEPITEPGRAPFYAAVMNLVIHPMLAAATCTKESTAGAIFGAALLVAVVGAIVFFAVANAQARRKLAVATVELSYLRPENARLHHWLGGGSSGFGGAPVAPLEEHSGYGFEAAVPPQWYSDPSGRHELRYWNGTAWTDDVSDHGASSTDPAR
jgi:Protein of unknown function (DUF2510)